MHPEILSDEQKILLPLMKLFRREFYLVGGTAIALHIGHRKSVDFDMFKATSFRTRNILAKIEKNKYKYHITRNVSEQLNLVIMNVKMTFYEYPYPVDAQTDFKKTFRMPDLLTLAAMKAFALGRRSKWKDYVDLYFLLNNYFDLKTIINKAESIFGEEFSDKLFRAQLAFHKDIDYSEEVEFMNGYAVENEKVKQFLIDASLENVF